LLVELLPQEGLSAAILLLGAGSAAAFALLYWWEKRCPHPLLPLDMFRNRGLAMLFTLALLVGVTMYSLLFYAPLLLQGGFGLSPQEAGLLITPMVVFITVGSIVNGRIITRIRHPNRMLYAGFILLALSCLGIVTTHSYTSHAVIAAYMLMAGLGMGFIMPNLTVFAQQTAGRSHLGIATALLQSLRMIGGMLGTAIVGTMVSHSYFSGVESTLRGASARWLPELNDPQMLVNPEAQTQFLAQLAHQGQDGTSLIEIARVALVGAIHEGQLIALAVAVFALWCVRRVPPVQLVRPSKPEPASVGE
jgi:MFS family permease